MMSNTIDYIRMFLQFPVALRRLLKHTLTLDDARQIVRERMEHRGDNFLRIIKRNVYGYPRSPYFALLKMAGCEFEDLSELVKQHGLEGTLLKLREEGVYVTFEEFKGRKPIIRFGKTIPVKASDFDNPFARRTYTSQTSGSTGLATYVALNLDYFADKMPHQILFLNAYNVVGALTAYWQSILPGAGLQGLLLRTDLREPLHYWFSPQGWRESKYWLKYDVATLYMFFWLRTLGACVPFPKIVNLNQPLVIARWIHNTLKTHSRCVLHTHPSHALRVAVAAQEARFDLTGATVRIAGEPVTPAKVAEMKRVGLRVVPGYSMTEVSAIALGCVNPIAADDMHLFKDAFALITYPYIVEGFGIKVPAFNLTTLLDSTSKLMFNVQIDDYGMVEERSCGCEYETYGYTTHLREIRSYSKLVGESVTLIGNEMLRILEEELPARFGGSSLDYQLVEEEDKQGFTRLYLLIHPRIEIANEQVVIEVVLKGLRGSSPMADAARTVWQQAHSLRIKRQEPVVTAGGKFLPLRIQQ
jgi:hypothetical protein